MEKLFFVLPLIILTACGAPETSAAETQETKETVSFDWLIGSWRRVDDQPGRQTHEYWKRSTNVLYSGFGYTMEGRDTVAQETMRLYNSGDTWTLEVSGDGEKVPFEINKISATSFTGTNPQNEFPKVITYQRRDESLYATISAEDMVVLYTFERKQ